MGILLFKYPMVYLAMGNSFKGVDYGFHRLFRLYRETAQFDGTTGNEYDASDICRTEGAVIYDYPETCFTAGIGRESV